METTKLKVFKRYQNRKLYDVEKSSYVTVQEVLKLPVGSFQIFAHPTGRDVTLEVILNAFSNVEVDDKTPQNTSAIHTFLNSLGTLKNKDTTAQFLKSIGVANG